MLPTPTMRRASMRNCLIGRRAPRVSAESRAWRNTCDKGSTPRRSRRGGGWMVPPVPHPPPTSRGTRTLREPAPRDFDLGEFRHGCKLNIPKTGRSQMFKSLSTSLKLLSALALAAAVAQAQAQPAAAELNEATLYDLLLGEIALQRDDPGLAAKTFLDLAKRTRDARIARRAVEVANFARMPELALEAAKTWQSIEPNSPQALQVVAALLIGSKRVEEAEPYIEKLLAADGVNVENGFLQLKRLLAGNPDKQSNLRVVRSLAAKHPKLAQSH